MKKTFQYRSQPSFQGSSLVEILVTLLIFLTMMLGSGLSCIEGLKLTRDVLHQTRILISYDTSE